MHVDVQSKHHYIHSFQTIHSYINLHHRLLNLNAILYNHILITFTLIIRGGDLGRLHGGTVPPKKFDVGDGPCIRPPNILRRSVVGCARKYEQSKKGVFLVRKGSYTTFNIVMIRKIWEKRGKIRKSWSMTKKGHH